MTCPLYSVFHVVLSTQSLPACGETLHHTSFWIDFARHVLAERGAMCPGERRGGLSGAGGSSFANIAPTTVRCRQSMAASACRMISPNRLFPTVNYVDVPV